MDINTHRELLAKYMVGRYRLGNENIALYLAGTLFETLINNKLAEQGGWDDGRLEWTNLQEKINSLDEKTLQHDALFMRKKAFTKYVAKEGGVARVKAFSDDERVRLHQVRTRLHNFRWLRNKIMHGQSEQADDDDNCKNEDLINYLWCELAPDSFEKAFTKRRGNKSIVSTLYEHSADYMVRSIDEVEALRRDMDMANELSMVEIVAQDFDNLFDLRRKLVPLKNYLSVWLTENAPFLQTDVLTTIDTTSAYIWMPLVPRDKSVTRKRSGVYDCSVSLLATPLDLRIYMDFGGYNRDQRKLFFDFISGSPEYEEVAKLLSGKPSFEVFDVDWYSAIFNRRPFSAWLAGRSDALEVARKKLDSAPKPENSPITWNRCLHGYIFPKLDLGENFGINFAMIEQPLRDMIAFYDAFQRYKVRLGEELGRV